MAADTLPICFGGETVGKFGLLYVIPAAMLLLSVSGAPASASACEICTGDAPIDNIMVPSKRWTRQGNGWKFRTRLSENGLTASDPYRIHSVTSLTSGNDNSAMSLNVERYYSAKRKRVEQINLPLDRLRRSRIELGYGISPFENERIGFTIASTVERRRLGFAALRGKWANNRSLGVGANWIHADHWRVSTSYVIDQSHNPRTGLRRGIQLAAGAPPSAEELRLGLDYSPSFLSAESIRIGLEARADRLSSADAAAYAMRERAQQSLAMKMSMAF